MVRIRFVAAIVSGLTLSAPIASDAQQQPASAPGMREPGRDSVAVATEDGRLFTGAQVRDAVVVAGLTAVLIPFDPRITGAFREHWPQRNHLLRDGARAFNTLGDPGTVIVSVAIYGAGRALHAEHLTDLGLHTTEALLLSGVATWAIKGAAGRQRPYVDTQDADDFGFGRGFLSGTRASFPSGHTSAAFAVASAVSAEIQHWWPQSPWFTGPLLYGGAGLVGLARIYDAKHWASDVVLAAGLGTLSGVSVVRFNHARPHNRVDRWLGVVLAPGVDGGVCVGLSVTPR